MPEYSPLSVEQQPVGLIWTSVFPSTKGGTDKKYLAEVQESMIAGVGALVIFDMENDNAQLFSMVIPTTLPDNSESENTDDEVSQVTALVESHIYS